MRESGRYLLVGREAAARPDPVQAAWLYAQMVRQPTPFRPEALKAAMAVFSLICTTPHRDSRRAPPMPSARSPVLRSIRNDVQGHLAAFKIGRWKPRA